MKFETKYRVCLWYNWLGQGIGLLNMPKYFVFMFGVSSNNLKWTMIFGLIWAISCFIIGMFWYKHGWKEADAEVANRYNKFVKEMRKSHKKRKI